MINTSNIAWLGIFYINGFIISDNNDILASSPKSAKALHL